MIRAGSNSILRMASCSARVNRGNSGRKVAAALTPWEQQKPQQQQQQQQQAYTTTGTKANIREHSMTASLSSTNVVSPIREMSTAEVASDYNNAIGDFSYGDLFSARGTDELVGRFAATRRTFGPRSNANAMLLCGGPDLAREASFDPSYERAKQWIQTHAVGPAVVSPILTSGLVGTLVEAAIPSGIVLSSSSNQILPLIVGVEVEARVTVTSVTESSFAGGNDVTLETEVIRIRDDSVVATGHHTVWMPSH